MKLQGVLKFIGTRVLKALIINISAVLVKRTETKFDDELHAAIVAAVQ